MSAIKITTPDRFFSLCVRKRAAWTCEKCHTSYGGPARGLECSHYVGRRNHSTRFSPLNGTSLCTACHMHMGANPHEHTEFMRAKLGPYVYPALIELSQNIDIGRAVRRNLKEVAKHYKNQFETMHTGGSFDGYL